MPAASPDDEIVTREALEILGLADPSSVSRYVAVGKLTPSRKLPGRNGPFLFRRGDVEELAAEIRSGLVKQLARIDAARNAS
jgi:hypothetical protein